MNTKTLQTRNVITTVLDLAEARALADGLSSVQDAVRIFLSKYAKGEIQIGFAERISPEKEAEYLRDGEIFQKKIRAGKVKSYSTAEELLADLNKNVKTDLSNGKI